MNFTYADSENLPLKEFRNLAQEHFRDTQAARASVYRNYKILVNDEPMNYDFEYYDTILQSILSLKDIVQHFSSLFHRTSSMPNSIYTIHHSMIKALRCIDKQAGDLVFQILALKDISPISSKRIILHQRILQQDLEQLLQDSDNAIWNMRAFIDRVSFLENK